MELNDIDVSVIWVIAISPNEVRKVNNWVSEVVRKHSDKFVGFASVHPPHVNEALAELDRAIKKLELSGLKLHPDVQGFRIDDPSVDAILARAKF